MITLLLEQKFYQMQPQQYLERSKLQIIGELVNDSNILEYYLFDSDSFQGESAIFNPDSSSTPIFTADSFVANKLRFVDTSSRIDIRTFKGAFSSSLNSIENIVFTLNIYESDALNRTLLSFLNRSIGRAGVLAFTKKYKEIC